MKKVSLGVSILLSFSSHSQAGQKRLFLKQQEQTDFFNNTFLTATQDRVWAMI